MIYSIVHVAPTAVLVTWIAGKHGRNVQKAWEALTQAQELTKACSDKCRCLGTVPRFFIVHQQKAMFRLVPVLGSGTPSERGLSALIVGNMGCASENMVKFLLSFQEIKTLDNESLMEYF